MNRATKVFFILCASANLYMAMANVLAGDW